MYILNKYKILEEIGSGSFGTIYKGENMKTSDKVAIKMEPINSLKLLKNETNIYQYLKNIKGIPNVKWFGKDEANYYMVIQLLGESLESMKQRRQFSFRLIIQIAVQMIEIICQIHDMGLIHRDIKPENFLLSDEKQIYLIDFGFCKTYLCDNVHIRMKNVKTMIGTPNFASIHSHDFIELSRRDDLESIGYILCYFYLTELKWSKIPFYNENNEINVENNIIIKELKQSFVQEVPDVLKTYLLYVQSLSFTERPNYSYIIELFKDELE